MAEFFCAAKPFHGSSKMRAPAFRAISRVSSVEPESTTTISCAQLTLSSVRGRLAASFSVIRTTERVFGIVPRINRRTAGFNRSPGQLFAAASTSAHSSALSFSSAAATFSSRCATFDVPGIGIRTGERCRSHASESCETVAPCCLAICAQLLRRGMVRLQQFSACIGVPGQEADALLLAPVQRFLMTAVAQTVSILDSHDRGRYSRASSISAGVTSLSPMWRILPCSCIRLSAPRLSSSGVRGSMRWSW